MMTYIPVCLSCGCSIDDPEDGEMVEGFINPVRYRHKDYTGCSAALNARPWLKIHRHTPRHATLSQIEKRPDTPWTRKK